MPLQFSRKSRTMFLDPGGEDGSHLRICSSCGPSMWGGSCNSCLSECNLAHNLPSLLLLLLRLEHLSFYLLQVLLKAAPLLLVVGFHQGIVRRPLLLRLVVGLVEPGDSSCGFFGGLPAHLRQGDQSRLAHQACACLHTPPPRESTHCTSGKRMAVLLSARGQTASRHQAILAGTHCPPFAIFDFLVCVLGLVPSVAVCSTIVHL